MTNSAVYHAKNPGFEQKSRVGTKIFTLVSPLEKGWQFSESILAHRNTSRKICRSELALKYMFHILVIE